MQQKIENCMLWAGIWVVPYSWWMSPVRGLMRRSLESWGPRKGTPTPTPIPSNINQFVLVSKPQPQATNINQHQAICFVLWICFILTVGGQMGEVWEVCSKGSPHRSINPASGICFWDASIHQPWKAYRWCPQGRAMEMSEKWIS